MSLNIYIYTHTNQYATYKKYLFSVAQSPGVTEYTNYNSAEG